MFGFALQKAVSDVDSCKGLTLKIKPASDQALHWNLTASRFICYEVQVRFRAKVSI